jgi:acyl-CoA thioesterase FadM
LKYLVVARIETKHLAPARLGDELAIEAQVVRLGRCSLEFEQRAWRAGVTLAQGHVMLGRGCAAQHASAVTRPAAPASRTSYQNVY